MAKAKVNIPWPDENYVVYDWPAGSGRSHSWAADFWERRRQHALKALQKTDISYTENVPKLLELGDRMISIGKEERTKELNYLRANLPDFDFTNIDDKQLITTINEIISGKDQFKYALDRIKAAIKLGRKKNQKGEDYKGLAPTMSSVFMGYMTTALTNEMDNLAKTFSPAKAVNKWKQNLDSIFERAVDQAMEAMLEESSVRSERDEAFGDATQWREIGEAYKSLQQVQKLFKNMLKSQLNLEELRKFFDDEERKKILRNAHRSKGKGKFRQALNWDSQQLYNNVGGNVQEYVRDIIEQAAPKQVTLTEKRTTVVQGKIVKTDHLSLYEYKAEANLDLTKIFYELENYFSQSFSLENAARRFQEFYDRNLAHLNKDNFIIMTNTKMASLGSGFSGFHNGQELPLERLVDYIDAAGITTDKAKDFINMAYNTLDTAIYADRREEVEENIRNILTAAAAKLLFDDWSTIGTLNPGTQVLNFFDLDGVVVPSSIFFIALGKAMKETAQNLKDKNTMKTWFSVYVNLPKTVVYKNEPGRWESLGDTNESIKQGIWDQWEKQAKTAREESSFETKFLINFKSFIQKYVTDKI